MVLLLTMEHNPIVIDNGSGITKSGFSGFFRPCLIYPTIIGYTKYKKALKTNLTDSEFFIGKHADKKRSILEIQYPIKNGIVDNWDDMIKIWEYTFNKLDTESKDKKVLLTEPPLNPIKNKEHLIETMFEYFNVSSTFIGIQGILSLYGMGKTTGVVLDIGHNVTHIIPVYDGYSIKHTMNRINFAGNDITEYLQRLLELSGYRFTTNTEKEIVCKIKEKHSFCSLDYKKELKNNNKYTYVLPDGNEIKITNEIFKSSEILFNPSIIGKDIEGIQTLLYNSIMKTDIDIRKILFSNIVFAGGTTMINNFNDRLFIELTKLVPKNTNINIIASDDRQYSVWLGGSILSSLSTFNSSWITKNEYSEYGKTIIYRKTM